MKELKYAECLNCGTIHYIISEEEAEILKKSDISSNEFSNRNLKCCINCGAKDKFVIVSEEHVDEYLCDDKIAPILIEFN